MSEDSLSQKLFPILNWFENLRIGFVRIYVHLHLFCFQIQGSKGNVSADLVWEQKDYD